MLSITVYVTWEESSTVFEASMKTFPVPMSEEEEESVQLFQQIWQHFDAV